MKNTLKTSALYAFLALITLNSEVTATQSLRVLQGAQPPPSNSPTITKSSYLNLASFGNETAVLPTVSYGSVAKPGDFPYMGFMEITYGFDVWGSPQRASCAGTLIAPRVVLTAAHCLNFKDLGSVSMSFGITKLSEIDPSKSVLANTVVIHPRFNPSTQENDVALVELEQGLNIPLVALNTKPASELPSKLYIAGWGFTELEFISGVTEVSDTLNYAIVPYVNREKCAAAFNSWGISLATPTHICAGGVKSDTCLGDSGGPLAIEAGKWPYDGYTENIQVGITSKGPVPCGGTRNIGAYTEVALYVPWINNEIVYRNFEGTSQPKVLNSLLEDYCFDGPVIQSIRTATGGDCCDTCKKLPSCGLWTFNAEDSTCLLLPAVGWTDTRGTCTSGYLNRNDIADNTGIMAGYRAFKGQTTLNVTTGATTVGACASLCLDTEGCAYFTWLGSPDSNKTFNAEGANCWLVDEGATPVTSTQFKGGAWGIATLQPVPGSSPFPIKPEPPAPRSSPPPPPPKLPPPRRSPPPPKLPTQPKICILRGKYRLKAMGRTQCSTVSEKLAFKAGSRKLCSNPKVKVNRSIKYSTWTISTNAKGHAILTAAKDGCMEKRRLSASSTNKAKTDVYLSEKGSQWIIKPVSGTSCSLVHIISKNRQTSRWSSYLSSPAVCKVKSPYTSNRDNGSGRQRWRVVKVA